MHWFLPFASLFLVQFGGWAIGMRNLILYELESDYSHYLEALGAPRVDVVSATVTLPNGAEFTLRRLVRRP